MFLRPLVFHKSVNCLILSRFSSSNTSEKHRLVLTDNGSTFIAWHPPRDFPYDCTKPLPITDKDETSVLKTKFSAELMEIFKKKNPDQARQQLMNITHTTKHRWFPRARDKKARKIPMDRTYL